jgi:peptidoglycan hydrolase CwlO-like protein
MLLVGGAEADPGQTTASVEAKLAQLNQQADQLVESFLQAQGALDATNAQLKVLTGQADDARRILDDLRDQLGRRAAATYEQGGAGNLAVLLDSGDASETLNRFQVMDVLTQQDADLMANIKAAQDAYAAQLAQLKQAQKQQAAEVADLQAKKDKVNQTIKETQALLGRLKAADRQREPVQ